MPASGKYEISTYPYTYTTLHMYEAIIKINNWMQVFDPKIV